MSQEAELLATASERVGSVLHGKYHLDGVLGVGGMATVYAATHRNRKRFAVKLLHPEFAVRKEFRTRFVREGYVANSVAHPGVVAVLDDDVDETGSPFLVMELLEGATLDALYSAADGPIPVREALGIISQLLEVLEAAHRVSIVHRDVKPGNLFVLPDGQLKVLDFGIARLRDSDATLKSTRTGALLGTPAFMAPEQARAAPDEIDARTDVWGAGATLFTMLSACFVHNGDNARQIMIQAATEPARSIESLVPELPAAVVALVSRALSFERKDRWQSAAEMREAVVAAHRELYGEPVRADIAAILARTSASVATQPTELHAFVDPPAAERATASTPRSVEARRPRYAPLWWGSGAALLAAGTWLGVRAPSPTAPAPQQLATASATLATPEPPRLAAEPSPAPADSTALVPSAPPAKRRSPAPSTRLISRAVPAPVVPAAVSASRPPENPLKLELQ